MAQPKAQLKPFRNFDTLALIILVSLTALDGFMWYTIFSSGVAGVSGAHAYFLDVGQGDSELIVFPDGVRIMTDAGPTQKVLESLARVLPSGGRHIDLAIISHPQLDHFNGYNFMLDKDYRFGIFVYNGRDDTPGVKEWSALLQKIEEKHIPLLTLAAGDKIRVSDGAGSSTGEIDFLSPNGAFAQSAALNDTAFMELIKTSGFRTLFTADAGFNVENYLSKNGVDLHADILKVGHHGSKYSSGDSFLRAVAPKLAVIEVGAKNTYGHPAKATLARLASSTHAVVLRTDQNGTVEVWNESGRLKIKKEK